MSKFIEVSSQVLGLDWSKMFGFVIVVIQDSKTNVVLMVGVMNEAALRITLATGKVTFWSRTRDKLWTKGETSGNFLNVCEILVDCDRDTLLILVEPIGPTCHTGAVSCFEEANGELRIFKMGEENV
ncbi:MAG: phosphoribosyl-AMP cyclohydrolase [Patescibacteria group bacterium]|jgi:phosphoribosyl-ATP pyrophosphohydrolase/phosphoribosyl-AMP cyclohydrolase